MVCSLGRLIEDIDLLRLPTSLWGIHVDPDEEFLVVLSITIPPAKSISIHKCVLITKEDDGVSVLTYINDNDVYLPYINYNITSIKDVTELLLNLEKISICENFKYNPRCLKYAVNDHSGYCRECLEEVCDNSSDCEQIIIYTEDPDLSYKRKPNEDEEPQEIHHNCNGDKLFAEDKKSFPYSCTMCEKRFAKTLNLKLHQRVHTGKRPFSCPDCDKSYTSTSNLSTHIKSVHTKVKKHCCETCGMRFVHPRWLRLHTRIHTGEKPYECETCGKRFNKKIHLTVHSRTHSGERPYVCTVCSKGFSTSGNLKTHSNVHIKREQMYRRTQLEKKSKKKLEKEAVTPKAAEETTDSTREVNSEKEAKNLTENKTEIKAENPTETS